MRFDWDPKKGEFNRKKHGISFDTAATVFGDPLALSVRDEAHSDDEERWITVGQAGSRILVVVHTYRGTGEKEVIRLISARKATPKERKQYMNMPGGPR